MRRFLFVGLLRCAAIVIAVGALEMPGHAAETAPPSPTPVFTKKNAGAAYLAQAAGESPAELQPRYEPAPPAEPDGYDEKYLFGLTRAVADSTLHPSVRILLFPITVPLDIALLPFEFIGGLF